MRIFLAGATGVIGRHLVPLLLANSHQVIAATRRPDNVDALRAAGAYPIILDVFDREAVFGAMREAKPDAVVHQLTDLSSRDFAANARARIHGTRNLVDAALAVGVGRMVTQSIAFAYVPGNGPATESEQLDTNSRIAQRQATAKAVATMEAAVAEIDTGVILRYGLLYGPGTWYASDGYFAEQVRQGDLAASPDISSFIHVADAAQAAVEALAWPAGTVNIVDDDPAPATEWLPAFATAIGAPPPKTSCDWQPHNRGASNAKARQRLGWVPQHPTWRRSFYLEHLGSRG